MPNRKDCGSYMEDYIGMAGGYLVDPTATSDCSYCTVSNTNTYLAAVDINYENRWRDFGILWIYIV
ncbi:hypothetical protein HKX48_004303 [Thoreauomyces humboldtii]|nr:hypothetical protein HKX48_004303 [Thoreauomyces humboldtii]